MAYIYFYVSTLDRRSKSDFFHCEATAAAHFQGKRTASPAGRREVVTAWARWRTARLKGAPSVMYLVASLAVAAEQREVSSGGAVLGGVVVQTLGVNP